MVVVVMVVVVVVMMVATVGMLMPFVHRILTVSSLVRISCTLLAVTNALTACSTLLSTIYISSSVSIRRRVNSSCPLKRLITMRIQYCKALSFTPTCRRNRSPVWCRRD